MNVFWDDCICQITIWWILCDSTQHCLNSCFLLLIQANNSNHFIGHVCFIIYMNNFLFLFSISWHFILKILSCIIVVTISGSRPGINCTNAEWQMYRKTQSSITCPITFFSPKYSKVPSTTIQWPTFVWWLICLHAKRKRILNKNWNNTFFQKVKHQKRKP